MLKVYTVHSGSHQNLFDNYFLPSLANTDLELLSKKIDQKGDGEYSHDDYLNGILRKVETIIQAIRENENDIFVFSDVDIIFFKKVSKDLIFHLENKDIVFQTENFKKTLVCTGFFICRANKKTLALWEECERRLRASISSQGTQHDQDFINQILREDPGRVHFGLLPPHKYYSPRGRMVDINNIFPIPKSVHMYHANWTLSIHDKAPLLFKVREIIKKQQGVSIIRYYLGAYLYACTRMVKSFLG